MPEENLQFVRRFWELIAKREIDQAVAPLDDDFVWIDLPSLPGGSTRYGATGVVAAWENVVTALPDAQFELEREVVSDNQVVTEMRARGTGGSSGASGEIRYGVVWSFTDGRPTKAEHFTSFEKALEAAGLSE